MEDNTIKIACVGDSITFGLTLSDAVTESYPSVLKLMLSRQAQDGDSAAHYEVGNFGVNGAGLWRHGFFQYSTTPQYGDAVRWGADIFVVCLGSNDAIHTVDDTFEREFVEDYVKLVRDLRSGSSDTRVFLARIPPILCSPELNSAVARINDAITRAAEECGAALIDFSRPLLGRDDLFSDGVHPNRDGARKLADAVFDAIMGGTEPRVPMPEL